MSSIKKKKIKVKIPKIKLNEQVSDIGNKKKMRNAMFVTFFILLALIVRIGFIQFYQGSELQAKAYSQQTLDRSINPRRGTIYDATGEVALAVSSTVQTITVNPTNISSENKEKVARALTEIFDLDYETVLKKVKKNSSIETIVKKVDEDKADELRAWMTENKIETITKIETKELLTICKLVKLLSCVNAHKPNIFFSPFLVTFFLILNFTLDYYIGTHLINQVLFSIFFNKKILSFF